jgi:hypothetical protein
VAKKIVKQKKVQGVATEARRKYRNQFLTQRVTGKAIRNSNLNSAQRYEETQRTEMKRGADLRAALFFAVIAASTAY